LIFIVIVVIISRPLLADSY